MLNRLEDVFKSFQKYNVKYVVIGEVAPISFGASFRTVEMIADDQLTDHRKATVVDSLESAAPV